MLFSKFIYIYIYIYMLKNNQREYRKREPLVLCFCVSESFRVLWVRVVRNCRRKLQKKLLMTINDLPISLLLEILYLLDQKSLMRCKCVSRQWCSFISDPSFVDNFVRLHASDRRFILLVDWLSRPIVVFEESSVFKFQTYKPPIYQHVIFWRHVMTNSYAVQTCSVILVFTMW